MDTNNDRYYDSVADDYVAISSARSEYLSAVDQIVVNNLRSLQVERLLDIGAGDGRRTKHLADSLGVRQVTAIERSSKMAAAGKQIFDMNVLVGDFLELELPDGYFDAVVSLWNVFGHIPNKRDRVEALRKISMTLKPTGKCIIDVNNRYNACNYGWLTVVQNVLNDLMGKSDSGWFPLEVGHVQARVYIHRPSELKHYLSGINLRIDKTYYVDYRTGIVKRMPWEGQCVYVMSRIE